MRSGKVTCKAERLFIRAEKLPIRDALYPLRPDNLKLARLVATLNTDPNKPKRSYDEVRVENRIT